MEHFLDESGLEELPQLRSDRPSPFLVEAAQPLLNSASVRQDIKGVLGDLPRDAWHVRGAPRENVGVGAEEVDEHCFLFRIEGRADPQRLALGGRRVEGDPFGLLGGLERADVLGGGAEVVVDHLLQRVYQRFIQR